MTHRNLLAALFGVSFSMSATLATAADIAAGEKVFKKKQATNNPEIVLNAGPKNSPAAELG